MRGTQKHIKSCFLVLILTAQVGSCKSKPSDPSPAATTAPSAKSQATPTPSAPTPFTPPRGTPTPRGPALLVMPGQGLGPIAFGATFATIERHMEAPCEVKTESLCRYITRAVDFKMEGGVLVALHVQSWLRPVSANNPSVHWGMFNGGFLPDLRLGMMPWAIEEKLGKAARVEQVSGQAPEELHHYAGMILEYDRLENKKLALAGIRMNKNMR